MRKRLTSELSVSLDVDSAKATKINENFLKNDNYGVLIDHLNKAEIVPLDFRNLTPFNQSIVTEWIKALTPAQQAKIIIIR